MRLPLVVLMLGYAGLIPFLAVPFWLTVAAEFAPPWLDEFWRMYVAMIASFMAGSFWGFALPAVEGPEGRFGLALATVLMLLAWGALLLPFGASLVALLVVFALLLLADVWRERTLGSIQGYFAMRSALTVGVLVAIAWRLML